jgi:excisionase family DNA binding protein
VTGVRGGGYGPATAGCLFGAAAARAGALVCARVAAEGNGVRRDQGVARARVVSQAVTNICSMAHPAYLREKARTLRIKRKLTIDELAERLALSRSTIYYWVRDLPIPGSGSGGGWPASAHAAAARANRRKHRLLRDAAYRQGSDEFAALAVQPGFRDFVCLYVAEGYKRNRNRVQLSNSDEAVVRIATVWIARLKWPAATFLDSVPRRPGSQRFARFLEPRSRHCSARDKCSAQVEQRPTERPRMEIGARRAVCARERHLPPRAPAGVDRPHEERMGSTNRAKLAELRGVAQPGQSARFGGGRFSPVRIRPPR